MVNRSWKSAAPFLVRPDKSLCIREQLW
jgi:hypothetical protein